MNIFFLTNRLYKADKLFKQLSNLDCFYPNQEATLTPAVRDKYRLLVAEKRRHRKSISGLWGLRWLLSFIPGTKGFHSRLLVENRLKIFRAAIHKQLVAYLEKHQLDPENVLNVRISSYLKSYFPQAAKTLLLAAISFVFLATSLLFLGALAEDSSVMATILALFAGKFLIGTFAFFASKLPLLVLAKCAALTTWFSALTVKELIRPGKMWQLFSLKEEDVLFVRHVSLKTVIKQNILFYNNRICKEDKIRLACNPFALLIMALKLVRGLIFQVVDSLPSNPNLINKPSPQLYRYIKGISSIVIELIIIPSRLLQSIAHLPYDIVAEIIDTYFGDSKRQQMLLKAQYEAEQHRRTNMKVLNDSGAQAMQSPSYILNKLSN